MNAGAKKILLVEDDQDFRETVRLMIEEAGYESIVVADAQSALEVLASRQDVSLIVTDIMMAGLNGSRLIESVRSNTKHLLLPIIAMSGGTVKSESDRLLRLGISCFLQKPFGMQTFINSVRRALGS